MVNRGYLAFPFGFNSNGNLPVLLSLGLAGS